MALRLTPDHATNVNMQRDDRRVDELRPVEIPRAFTRAAPGSVLIRSGQTHVLCTASIAESLPARSCE
ncbi:MAG: hypothetical protein KAY37_12980 [Phycisphaerae bacterium]|nr:hypothetical protein [Phycisphaerae bacterium]